MVIFGALNGQMQNFKSLYFIKECFFLTYQAASNCHSYLQHFVPMVLLMLD